MSITNIAVILIIFLIMSWLFWQDLSSYKSNNHKDFKSILVSTGVLGTFIGIFIGLYGFEGIKKYFDPKNILSPGRFSYL